MLTSKQNPLVKSFRKLHQPKFRKQSHTCLLEGTNLMEAALKSGCVLEAVCYTQTWRSRYAELAQQVDQQAQRVELVSDEVLAAIATTQHPDGVAAIIPGPMNSEPPASFVGMGLVLEAIQDPGNLGTILRSSNAAGSSGLFLGPTCVALTNPKVMRASVGAWFRVPTYQPPDLHQTLHHYKSQGVQIVATLPAATQPYWTVDYRQPTLLLIGNEGAGLSESLIEIADIQVTIPIDPATESLNAAIAASIILFEGHRQRLSP